VFDISFYFLESLIVDETIAAQARDKQGDAEKQTPKTHKLLC